MRRTLTSVITAVALIVGTGAVASTASAAAQTSAPKKVVTKSAAVLYKIDSVKQTAPPPGCVGQGCPTIEQDVPAYAAQTGYTDLIGAKEIDTYSVQQGPSQSFKGGCAIKADDTVACWGTNTYGQLGDGTTKDSETTPVAAVGLGKVKDIATNGFTTCAVTVAGEVKCVGKGEWPGFSRTQIWGNTTTTTFTLNDARNAYTESRVSANQEECQVSDGQKIVSTTKYCSGGGFFSKSWTTIQSSGVQKLLLTGSNGWDNSTICLLKTDGTVACSKVTPGAEGTRNDSGWINEFDCDGDAEGTFELNGGGGGPGVASRDCFNEFNPNSPPVQKIPAFSLATYRQRGGNTSVTPWAVPTWEFIDSGLTGVIDVATSQSTWGSDGSICMIHGADRKVTCKPFKATTFDWQSRTVSGGSWGTSNEISGVSNAESLYLSNFGGGGDGLCVYAAGTLSCGASKWDGTTNKFPTEVKTVAVMEKPLSIFSSSSSGGPGNVFFVTPSGILSAQSWIFNCDTCGGGSQSKTLTNVQAFKAASSSTYFYVEGLTGVTDNPDFIPANILTGTRKILSQKAITVKTSSGAVLANADVRWTAPDAPDSLSSSKTASDKTNTEGVVRLATLPTGPVAFTLKGGILADGTYLQAAMVVVNVPETGLVEVIVPVSAPTVSRKVSVKLTDGTPVPNAVITLRNNYLTFNYANSGSANASWSATAPDTKGYMQQATCAYCFVPPPTYITGADGTVTWKSYAPSSRSSSYDAEVLYDDGSLSQKVRVNFTGADSVVEMPFMANIKTTMPAEVTPKADGSVDVPVDMKDGDGLPIGDLEVKQEEVCGEMAVGGLWSGTSSVQEGFCNGQGPSNSNSNNGGTSTPSKSGVTAFAKKASCTASSSKTDKSGKATVKLCPTQSGYYRVRSSGVLPSKTFCVKVNNVPCTVKLQNSLVGSQPTEIGGGTGSNVTKITSIARGKKVAVKSFMAMAKTNPKGGKITVKATGLCKVVGKNVVADKKKVGGCRVTVTQAKKGKIKGIKKTFNVKIS